VLESVQQGSRPTDPPGALFEQTARSRAAGCSALSGSQDPGAPVDHWRTGNSDP
jgi:hypothetical protein